MKGEFILPGGVGLCNAVRRALLSDVEAWAPCDTEVRVNTSCQTDEYLAHRIGMIPFRRLAEDTPTEMTLRVEGPRTVLARDLTGPGFEVVHGGIEVIVLAAGHALDMTVRFDKRAASAHARYAMCAGVGMEKVDGEGRHRLRFETIDERRPLDVLLEALAAVEARLDGAFLQLAHQPAEPPPSMC